MRFPVVNKLVCMLVSANFFTATPKQAKIKFVALTFDDGPSTTVSQILDVFEDYNTTYSDTAKATLFITGERITHRTENYLFRAVNDGFELGNHAFTHGLLTKNSNFLTEISSCDKALYPFDKRKTHLLRPPYGEVNQRIKSSVSTPIILWSIDTLDWTGTPPSKIVRTVLSEIFDGAIVLMHDGYENTVNALKILLPELHRQGYKMTTVSEMSVLQSQPLETGGVYGRIRPK